MRFSLAVLAAVLAATGSVDAFAPVVPGRVHPSTQLAERADASALIEEARAMSKKYGPTSPEARVAWEAVEEVDAADNSEASKPTLDECELDEEQLSAACIEYTSKVDQLNELVEAQKPIMNNLAELAAQVKAVKLSAPEPKAGSAASPQLVEALKAAKAATDEFGISSDEAKVAWDNVEEIAAAGSHNAQGPILTDECLVETAKEACIALEELQRVLNLNKSDSRYSG